MAGADFDGSNVEDTQHEVAESDVEDTQHEAAESEVENPQVEAAENDAYEMLAMIRERLGENLKTGEYDKLKTNFNRLKNEFSSKQIDKFDEQIKPITEPEDAEKLKKQLSNSYDGIIEQFARVIETIEAQPHELGTEQQGISAVEKRRRVELAMGQGVAANLGQFILHSNNFSSCSPIVMFNKTSKIGGLFHFPAKSLDETKPSLKAIYKKINPTEIYLNERRFSDDTDVKDLKGFFKECGYAANNFHSIKLQSNQYAITLGEDGKNVLIESEIDNKEKGLSVMHDRTEEDRQRIEKEWQGSPLATKYGIDDWNLKGSKKG
ncbi:hypothetical protein [uncultured Nostoc sp.]|uniref:hypothetical protein n=1 Tax=uncultured Nostoc sp. TaxID=340711 RepID=UPI0035CBD99A